MNLLAKITLLCVIHCALATAPPKLPKSMALEWNQSLTTDVAWLSRVNPVEKFYDLLPGENNNSLAVLHWVNPLADSPAGFNLTVITQNPATGVHVRECTFPAEKDIDFLTPVKVVYLRYNRALVYLRESHKTRGSIQVPQVIDLETCELKEAVNTEPYVRFAAVTIVPFKNTFDVVFENSTLCPEDSVCRLTFDHDGKKLSEPRSLFAERQNLTDYDDIYPIDYESDKEGFVVTSKRSGVYSPIRGWVPTDDMKKTRHSYSNTSGYASVCWLTENLRNVKCTWLDGSHRDSTINVPLGRRVGKALYTRNSYKGNIAILKEGRDEGKKVIFSDKIDAKGECTRYAKTPFQNELKRARLTIFDVVDGQGACVSLVTRNPEAVAENAYSSLITYRFQTKCEKFTSDFRPERIDCGRDYA